MQELTNIIHTEKIITSYTKLINSETSHQLLPSKYHRWSEEEYLIYLVTKNTSIKLHPHMMMHLKLVVSMKTNICRIFLRLFDLYFLHTANHKYRKLFNRKNIESSYSCMPNMASVIQNHYTTLLKDPTPTEIKECSCRRKPECTLYKKVFIWIFSLQRFS